MKENKKPLWFFIAFYDLILIFCLTNIYFTFIIVFVFPYGDVAQLARANGSYPLGQRFESTHRYQKNVAYNDATFFIFIKIYL